MTNVINDLLSFMQGLLTSGNLAKTRRPNTALKSTFCKKIIQDNKGKTSKNMSSCVTILYQSFKWRLTETLEHFMKHCIPRRAELNVPDTVQHDLLYWAATEMNWPAAVMWMPCPRTRLGQICDSKEKWNFYPQWELWVLLWAVLHAQKVKYSRLLF